MIVVTLPPGSESSVVMGSCVGGVMIDATVVVAVVGTMLVPGIGVKVTTAGTLCTVMMLVNGSTVGFDGTGSVIVVIPVPAWLGLTTVGVVESVIPLVVMLSDSSRPRITPSVPVD